ncbi:MAG: O-antigen ligase family protein, partial [Candidatus Magasanikbacteria bacterium]|nr:O-antigen ligase family protein [Candidatus Magasanikbacteria bacterium]
YVARDVPFIKASPLYRLVDFQATITTRLIAWDIAWKGFKERPLTGWGFDNFHIIFNQHYNPQSLRFGQYETWFDRAHNTVLDVMSMTGLFGLIGFIAIYITIFYSSWRAYKKGWIDLPIAAMLFSLPIAYFVQNLFVFDHPAGFTMSYLLFALVVGATQKDFVGEKSKEEVKEEAEGRHEAPWIAYGAISLAALFIVWAYSITPFNISRIALRSNGLISSNPQMGIDLAKQARDYGWTPYVDEQSFLLSRNLISIAGAQPSAVQSPIWKDGYQLAKELSLEEISRHPKNTHPRFILARLAQEAFVGDAPEGQVSLDQYKEAIKLSPQRQQLHFSLARLYLMAGRVDDALAILKDVTTFDPDAGEPFWNYGLSLLFDKKDVDGGVAAIMQSQTAAYPYRFTNARELTVLTDALIVSNDQAVFDRFIRELANTDYFPRLTATEYGQIAVRLHQANKIEWRDAFLQAASEIDQNTMAEYTTILTTPAATTTTEAAATPANTSVTSTSQVATGTYKGPRN